MVLLELFTPPTAAAQPEGRRPLARRVPQPLVAALGSGRYFEGKALEAVTLAAFLTLLYRYNPVDARVSVGLLRGKADAKQHKGLIHGNGDAKPPRNGFREAEEEEHATSEKEARLEEEGLKCVSVSFKTAGEAALDGISFVQVLRQVEEAEPKELRSDTEGHCQAAFEFAEEGPGQDGPVSTGGAHEWDQLRTEHELALLLRLRRQEGGALGLALEWDGKLYDGSSMERLADNYVHLLETLARGLGSPEQAVPSLSLLTDKEERALLDTFSGRHVARALEGQTSDENLVDIMERQCRRSPDATAVVDDSRQLTYQELHSRARELASVLLTTSGLRRRDLSAGQPELVGLAMERNADWVVAMMGVLFAGMAYVPLDPAHPRARIENLVEQTEVATVLTTVPCAGQFAWLEAEGRARVLLVEDQRGAPVRQAALEQARPRPGDVCFVLFTSGSTGQPKGVKVTHQGVRNLVHAFRGVLAVDPPDVRSQVAPMTFDLHAMDVYCAFDVGAAVAICGKDELLTDLNGFIARRRVTGIVCTPTVASLLEPSRCPSLRWLALGGEMLPRAMVKKWISAGVTMIDHYGPTETSIAATMQVWQPGDEVQDHIGRPLDGSHVYILGPSLELLPIGIPGELCVAGVHVSAGYLKRADLTEHAYRPNPFSTGRHDRVLYRTGDRGRWLPSGNIQFLGRVDFQVKIRGNRVEPGEVEEKIARVEGVRRCVVVLKEDEAGSAFLAAYLVLQPGCPDASGLPVRVRDAVAAQCPSYMVPAAYVVMPQLPLTRSGKVDRKLLPQPGRESFLSYREAEGGPAVANGEGGAGHEPCCSEAERHVAAIFADLLGIENPEHVIFRATNFFELGGNSFTASQAVAHAQQAFGLPPSALTIRQFFKAPTVAAVAAALEAKQLQFYMQPDQTQQKLVRAHLQKGPKLPEARNGFAEANGEAGGGAVLHRKEETGMDSAGNGLAEDSAAVAGLSLAEARHTHVAAHVPLSLAQDVMWMVLHVLPKPEVVDMTDVWQVKGPLDAERLERSLQALVQRHQALRLRFSADKGALPSRLMTTVLDRWAPKNGSGEVSAGYARVSAAVTGLLGPVFLRNMHSIMAQCVDQIDQDPTIVPFRLAQVDLSQRPVSTGKGAHWELLRAIEVARRPFDMKAAAGLLFRVTLIKLPGDAAVLVFMWSHLIFDGISAAVFYKELQHVYAAGGRIDALPHVASYADYVTWEEQWLAAGAEKKERAYWGRLLGRDPEQLHLASHIPPKSFVAIPCRGAWIEFTIDKAMRARMEALAHSLGATLNMALLAAFHSLLHVYSTQRRIIVGTLVGRRPLGEHQGLLGHVADVMPIMADFGAGAEKAPAQGGAWGLRRGGSRATRPAPGEALTAGVSFVPVLRQVRERVLEALENQSVTLRLVVAEVLSQPDFAKAALIQAYFNFLQPGTNASPHAFQLGAAAAEFDLEQSWAREGEASMTPVSILLRQQLDGSLKGRLVYQADIYDRQLMEAMTLQYGIIVRNACNLPAP